MRKILKKSAAALAVLTLTAALAGCGSSASSAAASTDTAASTAETSGENELEKVKAAGKLVIGVEGTYPPFTYHDDNGELTGLDVELGKALAEKLGVEVEFQEAAWDSLLIGIDTGRFDTVINSVSITDERAEKYDFSDPYYYEARRVVVRADDDSINGPEDLNGKKIATNTTNAFIPWYEENGAFVIPNSEDVIAIPVRKGEPEFLDAINAALAELREEGTLKEISEKYLGGDYTNSAYSN